VILDADLRELLALLTEHRVEYLVVGGHAVAFHGYPRFTEDLDLFVRAEPENASRVIAALEAFGFGSLSLTVADFVADDRVVQLGRAPNRVDLLTRLWGVDFDIAWSRRVGGELGNNAVWILSLADLIRNKKATGRPERAMPRSSSASATGAVGSYRWFRAPSRTTGHRVRHPTMARTVPPRSDRRIRTSDH